MFSIKWICLFGTLLLICNGLLIANNQAERSRVAIDLLEKSYLSAIDYPPLRFRTEKVYSSGEMKFITDFRQRGNELDVLTSRYDLIDNEFELILETRAVTCDKSVMVHYDKAPGRSIGAFFTNDNFRVTGLLTSTSESAFLDGWSEVDHEHFSKIMMAEDQLVLFDELETVNGKECFVIESSGSRGRHKVWIAPEYGYRICKAEIIKKAADLYGSSTVHEVGQSSFKTIYQITLFTNINGIWFPVEGTQDRIWGLMKKDGTEQYRNVKSIVKRNSVEFNPNFDAIGAFEIDIPDGTRIQNVEFPAAEYVWVNGQALPYIERYALGIIEKEMTTVKLENSLKETKGTAESDQSSHVSSVTEQVSVSSREIEGEQDGAKKYNPYRIIVIICISIVVLFFAMRFCFYRKLRRSSDEA